MTTVAVEAIMPLIEEHTVMSRRTMPGTGFLDLMAAMSTPSKYPLVINDVHWGIPFVEDNGHIPKLQLKTSTDSRGTLFRFTSQIDGHDDMHASGCLLTDTSTGQSLTRKPELKTAGNAIEKDAFYDAFGARGIKLGPWFRRIETIQKGERELVATLRQASPSGHTLHAGILDAIFQTVSILADDDWQSELHYLPVGVERIEVLGDIHQIRSVHAIDTGGLDTKRTFHVHAYDEAEKDRKSGV